MYEILSERFGHLIKTVRGQGRLTEDNISDALRDVRTALLEADVALPAVRDFIAQVKQRALGREVQGSLTPGQALIKIVREELVRLMGESGAALNLKVQKPAVILLAGLQGSGKTTSAAKLAHYLREKQGKKALLASCDVYRPAALDQLQTLAGAIAIEFFPTGAHRAPVEIAAAALETARRRNIDVLIVDSAGRLHVDQAMMREIHELHAVLKPSDTLFVVDSMMGQDAVNAAAAFNTALPLTGVLLTKADGDARGGAALSVRHVTGKPILFMGTGEKVSALEPFHPDRVASRILGMGDVLTLIEEVEQKTDKDKARRLATQLRKGKGFTLDDFRDQLQQMRHMGGLGGLLDKLPATPAAVRLDPEKGNRELVKLEAIINSMTIAERQAPGIINGSRKRRIARGSGTVVQDVNRLLKQFRDMQKMMKRLSQRIKRVRPL